MVSKMDGMTPITTPLLSTTNGCSDSNKKILMRGTALFGVIVLPSPQYTSYVRIASYEYIFIFKSSVEPFILK